jgi:ACS family sodium-dependent inorganic phosphate cotransporter
LQGVLLGLSNTAGVFAGVFGTAATGYILQHGIAKPYTLTFLTYHIANLHDKSHPLKNNAGSWDDVFKLSVTLYLIGTVIWNVFSTGEKIID